MFFLHRFVSCFGACRWTDLELLQLGKARLVPHGKDVSRVAWGKLGQCFHAWSGATVYICLLLLCFGGFLGFAKSHMGTEAGQR